MLHFLIDMLFATSYVFLRKLPLAWKPQLMVPPQRQKEQILPHIVIKRVPSETNPLGVLRTLPVFPGIRLDHLSNPWLYYNLQTWPNAFFLIPATGQVTMQSWNPWIVMTSLITPSKVCLWDCHGPYSILICLLYPPWINMGLDSRLDLLSLRGKTNELKIMCVDYSKSSLRWDLGPKILSEVDRIVWTPLYLFSFCLH